MTSTGTVVIIFLGFALLDMSFQTVRPTMYQTGYRTTTEAKRPTETKRPGVPANWKVYKDSNQISFSYPPQFTFTETNRPIMFAGQPYGWELVGDDVTIQILFVENSSKYASSFPVCTAGTDLGLVSTSQSPPRASARKCSYASGYLAIVKNPASYGFFEFYCSKTESVICDQVFSSLQFYAAPPPQ